jgi:class 3 adenylate cyclase
MVAVHSNFAREDAMAVSQSTICKSCWQNMGVPIALRGPFSIPFRMVGIKVSRMSPNLCTVCETFFSRVYGKKRGIFPATVLFADLRGYTSMAEDAASEDVSEMLDSFYDECATAIWERDGVVNKFIGDAVLAIFNFPYTRKDHVEQATLAAMDIQRRWPQRGRLATEAGGATLGVGIGIHTGEASIGEIGKACKEFTITGPVVNMASRIQGAAAAGEILVSDEVYRQVAGVAPSSETREYLLKGIERPVELHTLPV